MGFFVNPSKELLKRAVNSKIYVDKSMILHELNQLLNTEDFFVCVARPRRFAKAAGARKQDDSLLSSQNPRNHIGLVDVIAVIIHNLRKKIGSAMGYLRFSVIPVTPVPKAREAQIAL